jgi:plastocyanin
LIHRPVGRLARVGLALSLSATALLAPASAFAEQDLTISAGSESRGGDVQLSHFLPGTVTINVGDKVTWNLDSTEFHNVYFPGNTQARPEFIEPGAEGVFVNPAVAFPAGGQTYDGSGVANSGLLSHGQNTKYTLAFTKAGTYQYLCSIHPGMEGTVRVVDNGQGVDTQASVDARRTAQRDSELANKALPLIMANTGEQPTVGGGAGVAAGLERENNDVQRFLPERVTIHQNESVTWVLKTEETPHTVTFLGGRAAPEVIVPQPQQGGPPRLQLNPEVLAPTNNNNEWNGASYLNSGFLSPTPGQPEPEFTVVFSAAGTYDYLCLLHPGMVGTVEVLPPAAAQGDADAEQAQ